MRLLELKSCSEFAAAIMEHFLKFPGPLQHTNRFWLTKGPGSLLDRDKEKFKVRVEGKPVLQATIWRCFPLNYNFSLRLQSQ